MSRYRSRLLPFIEQWACRGTRVAIFGTGPHTDVLFREVPELATVKLVGFLESHAAPGATYRTLPVYPLQWADDHADVIVCSSFVSECRMAALAESLGCKVITSHTVCGDKQAGPDRNIITSDWEQLLARFSVELRTYRRADATAVLTEAERRTLAPLVGADRVIVVPNAYPVQRDAPGWRDRSGFVFLAGFRHPPNVDAALYLLDEIMPLVWSAKPDASVTILGADPPDVLRSRADDRVRVTGLVPDLKPHLFRARVAVAPLRYGAGLKGKLCQAFGHGLANVTTSVGSENMALTPGEQVLVADSPGAFANAMLQVHADEALWQRLVDRGRAYLSEHHAPEAVQRALLAVLLPPPADVGSPETRRIRAYEALATGQLRLQAGDIDRAREAFARATELSPEIDVWLTIGEALLRAERVDLAVAAFEAAVTLGPEDPMSQRALAEALDAAAHARQALA